MKTEAKSKKVIEYLLKGNSLTKKECVQVFNYWNLSDIIMKLRRKGHCIQTTMKQTRSGAYYAEYKLRQ
jgi:uncharacterized protein YpiB (UPF0302 family)